MNGNTVIITGIALGLFCAIAIFGIIIAIVFSGKKKKKQKSGKTCAGCTRKPEVYTEPQTETGQDAALCLNADSPSEREEPEPETEVESSAGTEECINADYYGEDEEPEPETEVESIDGTEECISTDCYGEDEEPEPETEVECIAEEKTAVPAEVDSESLPQNRTDEAVARIPETSGNDAVKKVYRRSFEARLIQSDEQTKKLYSELKNGIMSYVGVDDRMSVKHEKFFRGKITFAKISFKRKDLCVYFAVPVSDLKASDEQNGEVKLTNVSDVKAHTKTPTLMTIDGIAGTENAKKLLKVTAAKLKIHSGVSPDYEYEKDYPNEDTQTLIERGLIRIGYIKVK